VIELKPRGRDEYTVLADRLRAALEERRLHSPSARPEKWPAEFRRLLRDHDERLRRRFGIVFDWYLTVLGEEYVPEAFCPKTLFEKLPKIERRFERVTGDDLDALTRPPRKPPKITYVADDDPEWAAWEARAFEDAACGHDKRKEDDE